MLVGYARVSTAEQSLSLQLDALTIAGCERIFQDRDSGSKDDRAGLLAAIEFMREGDTLVVRRLDRLARSLKHLIELVAGLNDRKVGLKSLMETIDTTSSGGKLIFHVFAALAEFEREIIRERTKAGLESARARGRKGGRPPKFDSKRASMAEKLLADRNSSVSEVCKALGVSRATLYRHLALK